jgi:ribosome recycling factor
MKINETKIDQKAENVKDDVEVSFENARINLVDLRKELGQELNDLENATESEFEKIENDFAKTASKVDNELKNFGDKVVKIFN